MYTAFFSDPSTPYRVDVINSIDFLALDFEMVRGETLAEGVLNCLRKERADMLITNTRLRDMSGFALAEIVRKACPRVRVIFLADALDAKEAQQAIRFGAYDYLLKSDGIDALRQSVTRLSEKLCAENREAAYLRSQTNWDEIVPQLLRLLSALRPEIDEENWRMYSRIKPLLSSDTFCMEALLVRSLMEELCWEIRCRDETVLMQIRDDMMQLPLESLCSVQAVSALLEKIRKLLVQRGLISHENALKSDTIGRACVYMHAHMAEKVTVQGMAEYVHISPRHFIRKFQAEMNETFTDYLTRIRIRAAIQMLEAGWDVKSIPESVGYKDEKSFYSVFRKFTGYSMHEYQQKLNLSQRKELRE